MTYLFDLNGTMIDDMQFHIRAWHYLLTTHLGSDITIEQTKEQMYGKNSELLIRVFGENHFSMDEMNHWSIKKEKIYQAEYKAHLKLINGLPEFLEKSHQAGILMGIGSAAIPFNIDFVLDTLGIRHYFSAIVSADDVKISKPDPETYLKGAQILNVSPSDCIVFEDAPKGVEAAANAGMKAVVLTTMHEAHEFSQYTNIVKFIQDYEGF